MKHLAKLRLFAGSAAVILAFAGVADAHSVAQVQTAKRISQITAVALDPQGNPTPGGVGTDTTAKVRDVLTFMIQFTPVPNNASRGAGGYITEYVPANTEVVGARIIDKNGNTVAPKRGPQMDDGWGPRGRHNGFDGLGLEQGSLSQVYADTGIFFSVDPRTARNPANAFISVLNGIDVTPVPTGAGQLDNFLGFSGPAFYAHNLWDFVQAIAYGANGGSVVSNGQGNTPFGFGSAVAGPDTHYPFEKVQTPACSDGIDNDNDNDGAMDYPAEFGCKSALDHDETAGSDAPVGPWQRIQARAGRRSTQPGPSWSTPGSYLALGRSLRTGGRARRQDLSRHRSALGVFATVLDARELLLVGFLLAARVARRGGLDGHGAARQAGAPRALHFYLADIGLPSGVHTVFHLGLMGHVALVFAGRRAGVGGGRAGRDAAVQGA